MPQKKDKCLLCKQPTFDRYWVYIWRQKQGYTCEQCGHAIHEVGYKILGTIASILESSGVTDMYHKEKFGFYRLAGTVDTPDQLRLAEALFQQARRDFPEFSFDFYMSLRHTNVHVK
jgi:ribosomal protein L37AE/L43A